jgi:hypothetical protein
MTRMIGNYAEFRKEKDPGMENAFKLLQDRKAKLRMMFTQEELDVIPPLVERF